MKQLVLSCLLCLVFLGSCKKEEKDPAETPASIQFPKTFKETKRSLEFKIWVNNVDVSGKVDSKKVFDYEDWASPFPEITLLDSHQFKFGGIPETFGYFFEQNGMYMIDGDTFPFPIAFGNYEQIEFYDYQIRVTSGGSFSGRSVFEKATKATLEAEAAEMRFTEVDTMAYMNRSLIMK